MIGRDDDAAVLPLFVLVQFPEPALHIVRRYRGAVAAQGEDAVGAVSEALPDGVVQALPESSIPAGKDLEAAGPRIGLLDEFP